MLNSKLIRILSVLSNDELKQLEWFVKSVFYNENEHLIQLYVYLRKQAPAWNSEKLDRKKVWKKVFPATPFNELACRKLMSNLVLIIERFIINELSASKQANISRLFQFYNQRYLTKDAESCLREWEEMQQLTPIRNADFYQKQQEIEYNRMFIPSASMGIKSHSVVKEFIHTTDIQYIITQLQWQSVMLNNANVVSIEHHSPFITVILAQIEQDPKWLEIPAIYIYYHLYKMIEKPEESHFYDKLNEASQQYADYLSWTEWVYIASFLQNYCIRKSLAGETIFREKLHELYIQNLKKGLIFSYNRLKPNTFRNIVQTALECKKNEWALNFIKEYKDKLPEEEQESLVAYCTSLIYFEEKKFKEVLLHLNQAPKTADIFQELRVKVLRIKTFYELDDVDSMNAALDALKMHISRQETLSEFYKKRFKNFANFLYRICYLSEMEKEKWQKLHQELSVIGTNDFWDKEWILKKVAEKGRSKV